MARAPNLIMCSFCGKSRDDADVRKLIAGPGVYICDGCVNVCNGVLDRELIKDAERQFVMRVPKPAEIRRTVNNYLIRVYRTCLEWFQEHVLDQVPFCRSADTQQEEERPPSTVSFTFRNNKRYRVEISLGLYQCLVSNTTIIKQMEAFGFHYVNAVGSGRNRTIEATWLHDDTPITVRRIEGNIDIKSEFPLAALLEGIGKAEELQPQKENPCKSVETGEKDAAQPA